MPGSTMRVMMLMRPGAWLAPTAPRAPLKEPWNAAEYMLVKFSPFQSPEPELENVPSEEIASCPIVKLPPLIVESSEQVKSALIVRFRIWDPSGETLKLTVPFCVVVPAYRPDGVTPRGGTTTLKLTVPVFPDRSRAEQVTVVAPTLKRLPDAGEQLIDGLGSAMSVALTV